MGKYSKIISEKTGLIISFLGILTIIISSIWFIAFRSWNFSTKIDESIIGQFGDFIGGLVGSFFTLAGVILYYVALKDLF